MHTVDSALASCRDATEKLIKAGEACGARWATPPAPGKWSPSQIVEHVARSLDEAAELAAGRTSKFLKVPSLLHPIVRMMLFRRVLKNETFPRAKTNKPLDPASGPPTASEGRARIEAAQVAFDAAFRQLDSTSGVVRTPMFGAVALTDYIRFVTLHTRHHEKQIAR